jgi:membrane-associated phospholipid phosphatase
MASREPSSLEDIAEQCLAPKRRLGDALEAQPRSFRERMVKIIAMALMCAVSVGVSVALIDRPVATWLHEYLGYQRFVWFHATYDGHLIAFGPFTLMASPPEVLFPVASFVFSVLVLAAAAGWRPRTRGRIVLALCLSIFAAVEVHSAVKFAFGRTWPESWLGDNPSWVRDGTFGFFPFHRGRGWESFPSGHTIGITTLAAVLWVVWPTLRIAWAVMVGVVITGLIGGNYHFVSDIIGGLYVGTCLGLGIVRLTLTPNDRLNWSTVLNSTRLDEPPR